MPKTEKLPKWIFLLSALLIGAIVCFGGQLFIAAAKGQKQGAAVSKSCTLDDGAVKNGKTTALVLGNLGQSNDDKALQQIDVTQFHLVCNNNKNLKGNKGNKGNKVNKAAA